MASYSPVYHLLPGSLYVGISICFMSAYFTDLLFVYLFHSIPFYFPGHYTYQLLIVEFLLISWAYVFCLPFSRFNVYLFWGIVQGYASCLPFSRYTILLSGK